MLLSYLSRFNVICLYETWTDECIEINNYQKFVKRTQKNMKGLSTKGRRAGGIVIYVRKSDEITIELVESKMVETLFLKIQIGTVIVIVGAAYRHPDNSSYYNSNFFQELDNEVTDIQCMYPSANIIFGGDFNSRVGEEEEQLEISNEFDIYSRGLDFYLPNRKNKDKVVNKSGEKLIEFCRRKDLLIVNGRTDEDKEGELTFVTQQGSSCIDLVLTDTFTWSNNSIQLKIDERFESNHFPVLISMKFLITDLENEEKISKTKWERYKWAQNKQENFNKKIGSDTFNNMKINIKNEIESGEIEKVIENLSQLYKFLGSEMKVETKKRSFRKIKNEWFDNDCQTIKSELKRLLRDFRKTGENIQEYLMAKKTYQRMCERKKKEMKEKKLKQIESAMKSKNEKLFWKSLPNAKYEPFQNLVNEEQWMEYFEKLFKLQNAKTEYEESSIRYSGESFNNLNKIQLGLFYTRSR